MTLLDIALTSSLGGNHILYIKILIALFIAILFLQSGFDKLFHFKDNESWLKDHFKKTPLRAVVAPMLVLIMVMEILAGLLNAAGIIALMAGQGDKLAYWGLVLSALSIIALFFGQRIAKDYQGALGLVPYFILIVFGMWMYA